MYKNNDLMLVEELSTPFLVHAPRLAMHTQPSEMLGQILRNAYQQGRAAWPDIDLPEAVFIRHLAAHCELDDGVNVAEDIPGTGLSDFYLLCACREMIPAAIATVEQRVAPHRRASAGWPGIDLPEAVFIAHLALHGMARVWPKREGEQRILIATDLRQALQRIAVHDLYLACACLIGNPVAIEVLEQQYLGPLATRLSKLDRDLVDEAMQRLRIKLLVAMPEPEHADKRLRPRIGEYAGSGALLGWLHIVLKNIIRDIEKSRDAKPMEALPSGKANSRRTPESELDKRRRCSEVPRVTAQVMTTLAPQKCQALRLRHQGLSQVSMGKALGVNHSTISRWLREADQEIASALREAGLDDCFEQRGVDWAVSQFFGSKPDASAREARGQGEEEEREGSPGTNTDA